MSPEAIIIRPLVTEKSSTQEGLDNQYTFEVHKSANKIDIRKAVEMVFGVRVTKVRTMVSRGDIRRVGRFYGRMRSSKKAIVSVHPGDRIDLYGEGA